MLNKRGVEHPIIMGLVQVVIPLVVGLALFSWVNDLSSNTLYEKQFIVREAALLTSAVAASPGNVFFDVHTKSAFFTFTDGLLDMRYHLDNNPIAYQYRKNEYVE